MITKPTGWDSLWGKDGTICSYRILLGEDIYTGEADIEEGSLKIYKPVFSASKLVGNTPCFSMECCLRKNGRDIPRGASLSLEVCLKNRDKKTEYLPMGTFKIYNRVNYNDGWVKLTCRNKMQMANQAYFEDAVVEDEWPKQMITVMEETAPRVGVTLDPRTSLQIGDAWMVTPPVGISIRAVWSYIAAAHGGNFIITPEDTLLLALPKASLESAVEAETSKDGFEVLGEETSVDKLTFKVTDSYEVSSGDDGPNNLSEDCPYASQDVVDYAKSQLSGALYSPVQTSDMIIDPAAEIQDTYLVNNLPVVWSELTIICGIVQLCEGKAEAMSEPENEYGFEDTPMNSLRAQVSENKQYAEDVAQEAVNSQTQEDIVNRLTNNGQAQGIYLQDGQLYLSASYILTGGLKADLIKAGVLQSSTGSFYLNLDTGDIEISGVASSESVENLRTEGVERVVTPVMKYSLTDEGLHIAKPGEEIDNTIDNEGMFVYRGSEPMLIANKDGVVATDVRARNYLMPGNYARFEDYNDGEDGSRTACFHTE